RHPTVRLEAGDAMIPRLAAVEAALGIEHQPVGAVRPGAELRTRTGAGVIPHNTVARDVSKQQGLTVPGRPFGGTPVGASNQFKVPIHKLSPLCHTRCCTVEEGIIQYQVSRTTRHALGLNGALTSAGLSGAIHVSNTEPAAGCPARRQGGELWQRTARPMC